MAATRSKDTQSNSGSANTATTANAEDKRSKNTDDSKSVNADGKENAAAGQPLGPPPRPNQNSNIDYFNQSHNGNNNPSYTTEPNPFEEQFGNPSDTPGKLGLPPLASLTSPSSLLPNDTPGWNSLRAGPLSPAMLTGPTGGDYFDSAYARGFPTPNESSMRTGLTPGGGGSMFPAPSPGTAAMFNSLGMNTPGTLDFLKSGINTRASNGVAPTSQPSDNQTSQSLDLKLPAAQANTTFDASGHADADAANGLFMLAQSNGTRQPNGFQNTQTSQVTSSMPTSSVPATAERNGKTSIGSSSTQVDDDFSDSDVSVEAPKPTTRSRGRKAAEPKSTPNNRRKATDTPAKAPSSKRAKNNNMNFDKMEDDDDSPPPETHKDGRKMTDEEKRKNFLERNRIAALKCRQRKKQWLANLQSKCDLYSQENDALTHTVNQLREQVFTLKQLLISHKDCPVTIQQNLNPQAFNQLLNQDVGMVGYIPTTNGAVQPMPMMMADGRQVNQNTGQVMPRA
jgi:ATF/CREB family transcription factor